MAKKRVRAEVGGYKWKAAIARLHENNDLIHNGLDNILQLLSNYPDIDPEEINAEIASIILAHADIYQALRQIETIANTSKE